MLPGNPRETLGLTRAWNVGHANPGSIFKDSVEFSLQTKETNSTSQENFQFFFTAAPKLGNFLKFSRPELKWECFPCYGASGYKRAWKPALVFRAEGGIKSLSAA